jgi:hypothetical protein
VQVHRINYLVPADAKVERERDLLYEALPLDNVLGEVAQAGKVGIVLLDSCRNNPFIERLSRSLFVAGRAVATGPGLARIDNPPRNTMVVMAAKADQIAEDGDMHSPFAAALLAHLQIPGLELGLFFRSVRDTVLKATNNRQEPYIFSSLGAEPFYFYPRPPNQPPQIGSIPQLEVADNAGPTPLGIPRPTDPDQDPLTVRITGLPRSGEVRVENHAVAVNDVFPVETFMTATYKPDSRTLGAVGTLDILVDDGRGGSVTGSLPILVVSSHHPPVVEGFRTVRVRPEPLGISPPSSPDGDSLTVTIKALPRGFVCNGDVVVKIDDQLQPQDLANLAFVPEPGFAGPAGSLRYVVDNGHGGTAEGKIDIEVTKTAEAWQSRPVAEAKPAAAAPPDTPKLKVAATTSAAILPPLPPATPPGLPVAPTALRLPAPSGLGSNPVVTSFQDCPSCPWMARVPGGLFHNGPGCHRTRGNAAASRPHPALRDRPVSGCCSRVGGVLGGPRMQLPAPHDRGRRTHPGP